MADENQTPDSTQENAPAMPTPQERLATLDDSITQKYNAIAEAVTSGGDIAVLTMEYSSMVANRKTLLRETNRDAINEESATLFGNIETLLGASNLATLMDEEITSLIWEKKPGEGENGPVNSIVFNKAPSRAAPRKTKAADGSTPAATKNTGTNFQVDGGEVMTARQFVDQYAPEEVRNAGQFKSGKFPTRPDFLDKTEEYLQSQGHVVSRVAA